MVMEIKSVILAAGKGTRMKSETPKVLHKIFDKTLLGYVLDSVKSFSNEAFVIVGHKAEVVTEFVNKNYSFAKTVLQTPQLGTGHAVSMVCPQLENFDGLVLILCGDTPLVREKTLKKFVDEHIASGADLSVMSTIFENPANYGRIIRCANGALEKIVEEKDATDTEKAVKEINAGIYCMNWAKIKPYGINSRENLATATHLMNQRKLHELMANGVTIVDPASTWISQDTEIGADTIVFPGTYIEGSNNKIGKNCKIGPFAHLRGDVEIADNVKIGNFVEVKKSKIGEHTNACHLTYIGDSELGANINIGAGTITANYNPLTKVKSKTVLKDNVKIGSNTVLVAPVTVEEGANVGAGSVITKNVPAGALALTRGVLKVIEGWVKR